ncbi:hypothetical protein WJX75_001419 [Coccomyxa subellipsoidea]|uniref:DUF2421 domain-containing protein n=1 Tax=Coccomyxa subellipsoidea TaxID=248742 RepID=A0ABR2YER1_9CHLO
MDAVNRSSSSIAVIFDSVDRIENGRRDLRQWSQGCLWGAITIITVNSPVLGKIAKISFERCLGTLIGGWLGITFILVLWTAENDGQAVIVAGTRVTCIVLAVLLMALLAMLIYPQIASEQVLGSLNKAMESTALLNRIVWEEPTDSSTCSTSSREKAHAAGVGANARGPRKRWRMGACLPVCCPRPSGGSNKEGDTSEDAAAKQQLDAEEKEAAERAALQLGFHGYAELEREGPFFDASTDVRTHQAAAEEQLTTALSELYVGTWAGRKWFVPTIFYHNQAHNKQGWHMPEKLITRLAMRMRRVVRVLNMIHATFRDGFQKEVLEELEHHFPLDLLVELSEAAIATLQAFVDAFPKPGRKVTVEMQCAQLKQLRKVTDVLLALAHTSRQHKVELILLGEEVRKAVAAHGCSEEELLRQLRALSHASREMSHSGADESLFLFPNTEPGWLATARWYSFHFLVHQLVDALERLRVTLNLMLPRLPGAHIKTHAHPAGDTSPTASETAEHSAAHAQRAKLQVCVEA